MTRDVENANGLIIGIEPTRVWDRRAAAIRELGDWFWLEFPAF